MEGERETPVMPKGLTTCSSKFKDVCLCGAGNGHSHQTLNEDQWFWMIKGMERQPSSTG